jgi:autotransporter-associated beta strand protein
MTGTSSYSGQTRIDAGTLQLGSGGSTGGLSTSSAIINNANLTISRTDNPVQGTSFSNLISGSGSLTHAGTGNTTLSAGNTYTGGTLVNAGTLTFGGSNVLADTGAVTIAGGTLAIGSNSDTVGSVTLNSGSITGASSGTLTATAYNLQSGSVSAILAGSGAITKTTSGTVTLTQSNLFTGTTTISGGGAISARFGDSLGAAPGAPAAAHLTLDNGTIQYYGGAASTTSLNVNRGVTLGAGSGTIDVVESTRTIVNTSIITGAGGLTKTGLGTLTLSNANAYGGGTTISGGTLLVNNTTGSGTGTGPVNVQSGATLGGSGSVAGSVTVDGTLTGTGSYGATTIAANGILTPGTSPGNVSFTSLTMADDSVFNWELEGNSVATGFDTVTVSGALAIGSVATGSVKSNLTFGSGVLFGESFWLTDKTWTVFTSANRTFLDFEPITIASAPSFDFSKGSLSWVASGVGGVNLQFTAVPEPTSLVFGLGLGVAGIVAYRRRKAKVANPGASASA